MTHNSRLPFRIMLVLAALSAMIGLICFAQPVSQAAPAAIVQNNVTDARWLNLTTGPALAAPSGKITAVPLTLTSANFNNDTRPDLIVGYETAVGGFLAYTEEPTVIYTPLQGEQFVTQLLSPMDLKVIQLLANSGWSIDRVLRTCVQSMESSA